MHQRCSENTCIWVKSKQTLQLWCISKSTIVPKYSLFKRILEGGREGEREGEKNSVYTILTKSFGYFSYTEKHFPSSFSSAHRHPTPHRHHSAITEPSLRPAELPCCIGYKRGCHLSSGSTIPCAWHREDSSSTPLNILQNYCKNQMKF